MAFVGVEAATPKEANMEIQTSDTEANDVSSDTMHMITSMKANMDHKNDILAALMAERKRPPTWALNENQNPSFKCFASNSVTSKNAIPGVVQTALSQLYR